MPKRVIFHLLLLLIATGLVGAETFTHPETKIAFPDRVGAFTKHSVEVLPGSAGTMISYKFTQDPRAAVTLYVFEKDMSLQEHTDGMVDAIKQTMAGADDIKPLESRRLKAGTHDGELRSFRITKGDIDLYSEARLYDYGPDYFFKVRITGTFPDRNVLQSNADLLVKTVLR